MGGGCKRKKTKGKGLRQKRSLGHLGICQAEQRKHHLNESRPEGELHAPPLLVSCRPSRTDAALATVLLIPAGRRKNFSLPSNEQ